MLQKANIEVDTRKLRQEAIIENKTCITKLTNASSKISGIKMPDDFTYKTKIEVLPSRLEEIKGKINGINKYIDQKASEFENLESSKSFGTQNYTYQNTSPLDWSPSYQGGGVPNMGYGGYESGMIDLKTFLENMKKTGAKTVDFFKSLVTTKVYADETYNGRAYNVEQVIDLKDYLDEIECNSLQGGCYDGHYIVLSAKKGDKTGGYVIWVDKDSKDIVKNMEIGPEGGDMEGITCDRKQNFILLRNYNKDNTLIRINAQTKEKMNNVEIPDYFRQHAYSKDTNELIGFNMDPFNKFTFMKYNKKQDKYVVNDRGIVQLNNTDFINIQGISCNSKTIYLSDSVPYTDSSKYKVCGYDFDGNIVEKHSMGTGYRKGKSGEEEKEVENTFTDDNGDTYLIMPKEVVKVKD